MKRYVLKLSLPVMALLSLLAVASFSHASLVAYWPGEGNALDASPNGHDGTLSGTGFAPGVVGQAFSFDGITDFISVPGDPALQPPLLSVALWVNASASNGLQLLIDSSHGAGAAGWAVQFNAAEQLSFAYGNGVSFPEVTSTNIIADNTFHHIAAVFDGSTLSIFIDGLFDDAIAYTGTPAVQTANGGNIRLGRHFSLDRPLNGLLDEVRVYDHALNQAEITALANPVPVPAGLPLFAAGLGLLGYVGWRKRRAS